MAELAQGYEGTPSYINPFFSRGSMFAAALQALSRDICKCCCVSFAANTIHEGDIRVFLKGLDGLLTPSVCLRLQCSRIDSHDGEPARCGYA